MGSGNDRETLRVICTCIKGTGEREGWAWRSFVEHVMRFCKMVHSDQEIDWAVPYDTRVVQFYTGAFVKMLMLDQNPDPCGDLCYSESDFEHLVEMWERESSTPRWDGEQRSSLYTTDRSSVIKMSSSIPPAYGMGGGPLFGTDAIRHGMNPSATMLSPIMPDSPTILSPLSRH